jgi:hypothetical protein
MTWLSGDFIAVDDTCIQCHSQGQPSVSPIEGKYYDWPVQDAGKPSEAIGSAILGDHP